MGKILLIGSNGLLGTSLVKELERLFEVISITRKSPNSDYNIDMASEANSYQVFTEVEPDFIINLAALTNVDKCEGNINLAYKVNTKIAENISRYSNKLEDVFVLHISTDHIYDTNNSDENDVIIRNAYAMTKYCGEKSYSSNNTVILRTNFFGKSLSKNSEGFCDSIYKSAVAGEELKLFKDVFFSPLSIKTLCDVVLICLNKRISGVFNVGAKDGMSKEEFLKTFLALSGVKNIKYNSISVGEIELKTDRPRDMRMNVSLFEKTFNYKLPKLINEIKGVANDFKKNAIKGI